MMEKQNWQVFQEKIDLLVKRLKLTLLLLMGGWIFYGILLLSLLFGLKQGIIQFKNLRAKNLFIVDERGRTRIELAVIPNKKDSEEVAALALTDASKRLGVLISVSSNQAFLSFTTEHPKVILMVTSPYETPALTFYDKEGKLRMDFCVDNKGPHVILLDTKGHILFKVP